MHNHRNFFCNDKIKTDTKHKIHIIHNNIDTCTNIWAVSPRNLSFSQEPSTFDLYLRWLTNNLEVPKLKCF